MNQLPVLIVGAGWAGLSAAVHLCRAGVPVQVLEAAPQAGGRARRLTLAWDGADIVVDNGQHLLLGAYRETLGLIDFLKGRGMLRVPMHWENAAGLRIQRQSRPADGMQGASMRDQLAESWSMVGALFNARGMPLRARMHLIRTLMQARLGNWRPPVGVRTVSEWYERTEQPRMLIEQFWNPMVLSAMNTPPESACAFTFLRVLSNAMGREPSASDFVLANEDLGQLFVDPALEYLEARQMKVMLRAPVREVLWAPDGSGYQLRAQSPDQGDLMCLGRQLVLACPPAVSARLLKGMVPDSVLAPLERFEYRPITTAYVGWHADRGNLPASLPLMFSLFDGEHGAEPAHWFFDRGTQQGWRIGAVVISDSESALAMGDEALKAAIAAQLARTLKLPPPDQVSFIHDKRATFACTPDRPVVPPGYVGSHLPNIALAGDYAYGAFPATLEGAVRAGRMAAEFLMDR